MANELITLRQSLVASCIADLDAATVAADAVQAVGTDAEARTADTSVKNLKACIKAVHDQRMSISRKVDAFKKALITEEEEICAAANGQLQRVQSLCATFLAAKVQAEEEARKDEAERIAKANEDAAENALLTGEEAKVIVQEEAQKKPIVSGVRAREYWTFDIVDENAVPRQYCSADRRLIQQYMDDAKRNGTAIDALNISGVKFRKEIRV